MTTPITPTTQQVPGDSTPAGDSEPSRLPRLSRALPDQSAAAPVRIVHLGLGNFTRAHQAWYTAKAEDAAEWGIAAFTGRRPDAAQDLAPQDGLYTLITRDAAGDQLEVVDAVSAVHPASDHAEYLGYLRRPEVAVLTITVTEAGYLRGGDGRLDREHPGVVEDLAALRADLSAPVGTLPAKLVAGLAARRAADAGAITVLSCDNLPENGEVTAGVVRDLAGAVDPELADWIEAQADFATSMVDRITPATTDADRDLVRTERGYLDACPVPTEPYAEWVVAGRFPAGRPAWDSAGARLVDDVTPYEQRKLWLLNGSHSLLAYAGSVRGHATIDEAVGDPECRTWVEAFWDEAGRHLSLPPADVADYRQALLTRFTNPRIRHRLAQIAPDGSIKLPVRVVPALRAERAAGRLPVGCATLVASWICHLRGLGAPLRDDRAGPARSAARGDDNAAAQGVLSVLGPDLSDDTALVELVAERISVVDPGSRRATGPSSHDG